MIELMESKRDAGRAEVDKTAARLLSVKAAAAYLGVSFWTLRDMQLAGAWPGNLENSR